MRRALGEIGRGERNQGRCRVDSPIFSRTFLVIAPGLIACFFSALKAVLEIVFFLARCDEYCCSKGGVHVSRCLAGWKFRRRLVEG